MSLETERDFVRTCASSLLGTAWSHLAQTLPPIAACGASGVARNVGRPAGVSRRLHWIAGNRANGLRYASERG